MKVLKYILLLLLVAIIGFSIYVAVQPNDYEFSRSKTINVPKRLLFNKVNDYKNWHSFSPWIGQNTHITFGEKTSGKDASYSWNSETLSEGSMTTIATETHKSITQNIDFKTPIEVTSQSHWTFKNTPNGTNVTWTIRGKQDFISKAKSLIMGAMESKIEPKLERGLFKLDSIVHEDMKRFTVKINGITEYGGGFYIYKTTNANATNISIKMGENFGAILQFMGQQGIKQSGMPLTVYNEMNENVIMSNGVPVNQRVEIPAIADVSLGFMPKMKVLKTTLTGNYTNLPKAWEATMKYISEQGLEQSEIKPFEIYTTDPGNYPNPADWKTEIYIPIK